MLLVNRINHTVDLVTVAAHHGQAQTKHPNLLLLGHVEHQLVDHGLRLVDPSDIGQRRRISNVQLKGVLALAATRKQARVLLALNLSHAPLSQARAQVFTKKIAVFVEVLRARVRLKGTLQLLQFKVGLLGDLRHRRRGIVRHLNVVVKLSRLQLSQVRVGLLGEHGEH